MVGKARRSAASADSTVEAMLRSRLFRDFQRAFIHGTNLPLELHPPQAKRPLRPSPTRSPICALMARSHSKCWACCALQQSLETSAQGKPRTVTCFAGMCESAVPVRVGENLIAFLRTGQVLLHAPTPAAFHRVAAKLIKWESPVDLKELEEGYFHTRVLSPVQYRSYVQLLAIFAGHLAECSNQLTLRGHVSQRPAVTESRSFIDAHLMEPLSLARIADAVNLSAAYFSHLFARETGMTLLDYIARVRVEKAKRLLRDPELKISGIAFDAGFQSLSQFNRVFKRLAGLSPSRFRLRNGIL